MYFSLLAFCSFRNLCYRDRSNQQSTCWILRQDHDRLPAADDSVHRQVDRGEREGLEADSETGLRGVHEARSPGQGEEWGRPRKGRYYTGQLCVCLFVCLRFKVSLERELFTPMRCVRSSVSWKNKVWLRLGTFQGLKHSLKQAMEP